MRVVLAFIIHILFLVVASIQFALQGIAVWLALFGRGLQYDVKQTLGAPIDSSGFCSPTAFLSEAKLLHGNKLEVLTTAPAFTKLHSAPLLPPAAPLMWKRIFFTRETSRNDTWRL